MGKWIARLQADAAQPVPESTDETSETRECGVLSVLSVGTGRGSGKSSLSEPRPDVSAVAWTDADIARFLDRRNRLMRWGWSDANAEALAERLVNRDRDQDDRVSCTDCKHYRPGRCGNHKQADLNVPDVGRDLASMLQRCSGFQPVR